MRQGMRVRCLMIVLAVALGGTLFTTSTGVANAAGPRITCSYTAAGAPGLEDNRLDIRVRGQEEATAVSVLESGRIEVIDDQRMRRLKCSGRRATVTNVDRISYIAKLSAENTNFTVVEPLEFSPGTVPYAAGGSGIDFRVSGKAMIFATVGSDGVDTMLLGEKAGSAAIDFGPEPANNGIDAMIRADFISLVNLLRGGNDLLDASGSVYFDSPLTSTALSVYGEAGNDLITGGNGTDILDGGSGRDTLSGSAGNDQLFGGGGTDYFDGAGGRDEIDAIDRQKEIIECGQGQDIVSMDLFDIDSDCEVFRFP